MNIKLRKIFLQQVFLELYMYNYIKKDFSHGIHLILLQVLKMEKENVLLMML